LRVGDAGCGFEEPIAGSIVHRRKSVNRWLRVSGCALRDDKARGVEQSAWGEKTEIRWLRVVGYVLQVAR